MVLSSEIGCLHKPSAAPPPPPCPPENRKRKKEEKKSLAQVLGTGETHGQNFQKRTTKNETVAEKPYRSLGESNQKPGFLMRNGFGPAGFRWAQVLTRAQEATNRSLQPGNVDSFMLKIRGQNNPSATTMAFVLRTDLKPPLRTTPSSPVALPPVSQ